MIDFADGLPFVLLWVALGVTVFPADRWVGPAFLALSLASAGAVGIVEWAGMVAIAFFCGACLATVRPSLSAPLRALVWSVVVISAAALATHQVPWIHNVLVLDAVSVSASAADYTLYRNYDKGFVGVLLYAVCVQPQSGRVSAHLIVATGVIALLSVAAVAVAATATGFVSWDPKWPAILGVWVPANLLVTCVAEETYFRGLLQQQLGRAFGGRLRGAAAVAILVAAAAFGAAHIAGGGIYVLLATLAGIGYGAAYHLTGRVETSILVHFTLNLTHLILFSYPFAA